MLHLHFCQSFVLIYDESVFFHDLLEIHIKRRIDDSLIRYNSCEQLMIRNVKCRIIAFHLRKCHRLFIPHLFDLVRISLLNFYIRSGQTVHINCRPGSQSIERYAVMLCEDSDAAGADFICKITVSRNAVTTDKNRINSPKRGIWYLQTE